jgi:hypothetical protein
LDHDCGVCSIVRLSSARREDVPMRRSSLRPAFSWRVWCPLSERAPAAVLLRKTGYEEKTPIFLGISILRPIREGFGFASAYLRNCRRLRDAGVLPIPATGQPRRDQAEEMPGGVKRPSARQLGVSTNSRSEPYKPSRRPMVRALFARCIVPPGASFRPKAGPVWLRSARLRRRRFRWAHWGRRGVDRTDRSRWSSAAGATRRQQPCSGALSRDTRWSRR